MTHPGLMRLALRLARRGYGRVSPNPMVGALVVKRGKIIGRGWHRGAGEPHAEIEALRDAQRHGHSSCGATLYVTLEPCSTRGRTPPCTEAILAAGIKRLVAGATDPNPHHAGRGFTLLQNAGLEVTHGILAEESARLNEAFNHWIVHRTPFVTVKAAMTLDGRVATAYGESKWITGPKARAQAMRLRQGADAVLVGINTVLADDPALTVRSPQATVQRPASKRHGPEFKAQGDGRAQGVRRIILDSWARTPLSARVASDEWAHLTTIVVARAAPAARVAVLSRKVNVWVAPAAPLARDPLPSDICHLPLAVGRRPLALDLPWLLEKLGAENVTSLLVEGGGEVNAAFLLAGLAQRAAFFYAPVILGDRQARPGMAGAGARRLSEVLSLRALDSRRLGPDWFLTARIDEPHLKPGQPFHVHRHR